MHDYLLKHNFATKSEKFTWLSFKEIGVLTAAVARGLQSEMGLKQGDFLGICATNRLEWYLVDFACLLLGE